MLFGQRHISMTRGQGKAPLAAALCVMPRTNMRGPHITEKRRVESGESLLREVDRIESVGEDRFS